MSDLNIFIQEFINDKFDGKIKTAFAYGSSVFKQKNDNNKPKMVDLIIIVDDVVDFHKYNIKINTKDYSFIKYFGPTILGNTLHKFSTSVIFNPYIPYKNKTFKYGIVSEDKIYEDLSEWSYLYLAGRLHKPVIWFGKENLSDRMLRSLELNLINAIQVALIFLPDKFEESSLFEKICELSYIGDFRCLMSIDSNKPHKIVQGNPDSFCQLYRPIYSKIPNLHFSNGYIKHDTSYQILMSRVNCLPEGFKKKILSGIKSPNTPGFISGSEMIKTQALRTIKITGLKSSLCQTFISGISSGGVKSFKYIFDKYSKAFSK